MTKSKSPTPQEVHRSAIVIDTHADTPQRFLDEHFDLGDPLKGGNFNLETARKGNLGAEFFSIWVDPNVYKGHEARRTLVLIDAVKQQVAKHSDQMEFVTSAEGIEQAHRDHKLAALMGIEGGHSIENSLALLRQYYALGVRYMTLTWTNSNGWADSSGDADDASVPHTEGGTERVRQRRGLRDEPAGHDGGCLARFGQDVLSDADYFASAGDCFALLGAGAVRCAAQHDGRHAARDCALRGARIRRAAWCR